MILIPLFLSATLDLSLPEFQPDLDASGNYITAYYDEEIEEPVIEYIPEEDFAEDGGFSPSAEVLDDEPVLEESPIEETPILRSSNTVTLYSTNLSGVSYDYSNRVLVSSSSGSINYIYLEPNIDYTITSSSTYFRYVSSLDIGSSYTQTQSTTVRPSSGIYLTVPGSQSLTVTYVSSSGGDEPSPDPSGNDPGGDSPGGGDFDDTNIVSKLDEIKVVLRAICFICLIKFLYPICLDIKDNIVGGDKNV